MPEQFANRHICSDEERIAWFREAKFGMFIHWGIYAQLAGMWKGKEIPGIGEQIMRFAQIPAKEYHEICKSFNPVQFDAETWVKIAKDAGMRYIVITAKHHDGFAMYHSHCSPYNIVDATPYGKDPMKQLAAACQKHGIRLCFYYSHYQDWDDPNGVVKGEQWDTTYPEEQKVFETYMNQKALPQVMELLTGYGPIGILWFDTPGDLSYYNARRFRDLVQAIQPECIVGPRVSNDPLGDYIGYGDNQVPSGANHLPWETCATMNDTWGFKQQDHKWKSPATLIRLLVSIVAKGGNYLLNVGPTAQGLIPPESVERLHIIGEWIRRNGEAIYGCQGGLIPYELSWGAVTAKENQLYLHLFDWKEGPFIFTGLKNKVKSAKVLGTGEEIPFTQQKDGIEKLVLTLPSTVPNPYVSVIALELEEGLPVEIDDTISDCDGEILLTSVSAKRENLEGKEVSLVLSKSGIIENWHQTSDILTWEFLVTQPGSFSVTLHTFTEKYPEKDPEGSWEGGHRFVLECAGQQLKFQVSDDERIHPRDLFLWYDVATRCGRIKFERPGRYTLRLVPQSLCLEKGLGPKLKSVTLTAK